MIKELMELWLLNSAQAKLSVEVACIIIVIFSRSDIHFTCHIVENVRIKLSLIDQRFS